MCFFVPSVFFWMPPRSQQLGINATDLHQLITSLKTCRFGPATALRTIHQQTCGRRLAVWVDVHLFGSQEKVPNFNKSAKSSFGINNRLFKYICYNRCLLSVTIF